MCVCVYVKCQRVNIIYFLPYIRGQPWYNTRPYAQELFS